MKKFTGVILFLMIVSVAYPQFNPENNDWIKKLRNMELHKNYYVQQSSEHDKGKINSKDQFDPVLANKFQDRLDQIIETYGYIGASVAISMPEKGIWQGVSGFSDPVNNDSMRTDMLQDIGSNTKTFTSTLMLLLAEDGMLSLDDSLHAWLPSYNNIDSTVTIRQLLNQTSGISDFWNENPACYDSMFADFDKFWTPEDDLSFVLSPNFSPGESWSYSNTNYILAGMIIKEATGSEVSTLFHERIWDPLGLSNTFLDIEEPLVGEIAHGWRDEDGNGLIDYSQFPRTSYYSIAWTTGAIVSTTEDMVVWANALYGGQILQQTSLDEMFTLVGNSLGNGYGLGTFNDNWYGENIWLHGGGGIGTRSQIIYCPRLDVSISVFLNQNPSDPDLITKLLLLEVLDYYNYPYDQVYPTSINLSQTYIQPNNDNLILTSKINNPKDHNVVAYGHIMSVDSTYVDSIMLYDDGMHNDSLAGDLLYGNSFNTIPVENEFNVSVHSTDTDSVYEHTLNKVYQFTTIGPVVLESYETTTIQLGEMYAMYLDITVKNESTEKVVPFPSIKFNCPDSIFTESSYSSYLSDIPAGDTITKRFACRFVDGYVPMDNTEVEVSLEMYSRDFLYSENNFSIFLKSDINTTQTPEVFELYQNYPNPFNPVTTISYSLESNAEVSLKVFNITGKEVCNLVSQKQNKGSHAVKFDGSMLTSGIYFYRLSIDGKTIKNRKMMLLK